MGGGGGGLCVGGVCGGGGGEMSLVGWLVSLFFVSLFLLIWEFSR